jgi:ring-1,2-phenylacetyl-CoA epoxidase subunit PaaD
MTAPTTPARPAPTGPDQDALRRATEAAGAVPDPEIPVLSVGDLGILRAVEIDAAGTVQVSLTPTYSGCPATEAIRDDVDRAVRAAGFDRVEVRIEAAVWTTDWISERGREALHAYGIAPPERGAGTVPVGLPVPCPRCGSRHTRERSRFGSTPCQSQWVCQACREPFDRFKPH